MSLSSAIVFVEKFLEELAEETIELEKEVDKTNKTFKKLDHTLDDTKIKTEDVTTTTQEYDAALDPLLANIKGYAENMTIAGASMEG